MQNHPKIELIIIDDCSQDNTVNLEKEWLKDNGNIFTNTKLIAQSKNYGTVANSNLGLKYSNGNYINFLAADHSYSVQSCELRFSTFFYMDSLPVPALGAFL